MTPNLDTDAVRALVADSSATIASLSDQAAALADLGGRVVQVLRAGGKVLTAGNGGSAAEALHFSEELVGRYRHNRVSLPCICLAADATALTCIGNDFGFEFVFSRQVEGLARAGDVLILFSTSGHSPNLVAAARAARARDVTVVGLLGKGGGALAPACDVAIVVRQNDTGRIQEAHQVILHILLEAVERAFPAGAAS